MTGSTFSQANTGHFPARTAPENMLGSSPVRRIEARAEELCVCGHPIEQHDTIAARYCAATISGDLVRGCVCAAVPDSPGETSG